MIRLQSSAKFVTAKLMASLLSMSACQEKSSDTSNRSRTIKQSQTAGGNNGNDSKNPSEDQTQDTDNQTSKDGTPTPPARNPQPLTETQATGIIRASCIYSGCHEDAAVLMESANILQNLQDNLMPPPNQQRYTLRSADRAALVKYFQDKNASNP